ncbi:MAG: hypothetical protein KKE94_00120 [Gammaproteobacteria bacterium]|nr:hypothetical protein [Gammaproteobacteria bacterium]
MTITIYADSNIYRYVAAGELEITTIGSVRFAYSSVHFDEMIRTGNLEMLKGLEALRAVPLVTNENGEYDIDSIGVCLEYVDPYKKFEAYKADYVELPDAEAALNELLLRMLGADNLDELKKAPDTLLSLAEDMKQYFDEEAHDIQERAKLASNDLDLLIQGDLSTRRPLTETRSELGYPKGATSLHENDLNPIDEIWERLSSKLTGVTKEQFFGFEAIPNVDGKRSRIGDVAGCHLILNMIGYHPDRGLPNREKIKNILSDGQHLGYGSMCGCFLTSDYRLYKKADAIFKFRKYASQAEHIEYKSEGMSTTLIEPGSVRRVKLDRSSET